MHGCRLAGGGHGTGGEVYWAEPVSLPMDLIQCWQAQVARADIWYIYTDASGCADTAWTTISAWTVPAPELLLPGRSLYRS